MFVHQLEIDFKRI